jgi:hypothetical protein
VDAFWTNLLELSINISMFPHPQDLLSAACKVQRDTDLAIVATKVMRSPYPSSAVLCTQDELKEGCLNPRVVIKQDFSDSTACTFLPAIDHQRHVMTKDTEMCQLYGGIKTIP